MPPDSFRSPDANTVGPRIDGFDLHERIGSGGFSTVYRATETKMGRDVAVKVLHADFSTEADQRVFERECKALGLLARHPNIVTVYSATMTTDGRACIVMELYAETLRDRLEAGPLDAAAVLDIGIKIAGALQVAHDGGVLHRDIKPHNIFMSEYGEPALGDFGISSVDDERSISAASGLSVAYAAPEVLEDSAATASSDVYSLAATLFHLAEGTAPFASPQLRTTVKRILTEAPPGMSVPGALPPGFDDILRRNLAKDPMDRDPDAREFGNALRAVQAASGLAANPVAQVRHRNAGGAHVASAPDSDADGETTVARRGRGKPTDATPADPSPRTVNEPNVEPEPDPSVDTGSADSLDAGELTVVRSRVRTGGGGSAPQPRTESVAEGSSRGSAAISLAALALLGAAGLGVMATRSDSGQEPVTTGLGGVGDDATVDGEVFFEFVDPPADLTAIVLDDGTVELSFESVRNAIGYEAESRAPSDLQGEIRREFTEASSGSVIATGLAAEEAPCWVVRSIGTGRRSLDTPLVCVDR